MVIEFVESDNPQVDLVAEARELLGRAAPAPWFWKHSYEMPDGSVHWDLSNPASDAEGKTIDGSLVLQHDQPQWLHRDCPTLPNWQLIARAPSLLNSLCNELEQLRSQHSVQAQNIAQLHEQEKAMRAAIEAAISWFEYQNGITSNKTTAAWVERTLRAVITQKGEQS